MRKIIWLLVLGACARPSVEDGKDDAFLGAGKADTGGIVDGTPEAYGILAFVDAAGYDLLTGDVGIGDRAAANLVNYKLGDDGLAGTADDQRFSSLAELDAVPYVGPKVFAALLDYARAHGWVSGGDGGVPDAGWPWPPAADAGSPWVPDAGWSWPPEADAGSPWVPDAAP